MLKNLLVLDNILDYACGSGNFLGSFENFDIFSIGVDISAKQINYANRKYGNSAKFIELDKFDFNSYKNKFNTITCLGLIEFIDKKEVNELIDKFYFSLKPGGDYQLSEFYVRYENFRKILNKYGEVNYKNEYKIDLSLKSLRIYFQIQFLTKYR